MDGGAAGRSRMTGWEKRSAPRRSIQVTKESILAHWLENQYHENSLGQTLEYGRDTTYTKLYNGTLCMSKISEKCLNHAKSTCEENCSLIEKDGRTAGWMNSQNAIFAAGQSAGRKKLIASPSEAILCPRVESMGQSMVYRAAL